eukprot:7381703-Prymnesium_polylepis.1
MSRPSSVTCDLIRPRAVGLQASGDGGARHGHRHTSLVGGVGSLEGARRLALAARVVRSDPRVGRK